MLGVPNTVVPGENEDARQIWFMHVSPVFFKLSSVGNKGGGGELVRYPMVHISIFRFAEVVSFSPDMFTP
jgi:hypothetical protein